MVSNSFKTFNLIQPYLRPPTSSAHKKNTTLLKSKEKSITSHVLNHIKNRGTKTLKQHVTTGFYLEVLEEKMNSLKWQRNYAPIKKLLALLKICTLNQV